MAKIFTKYDKKTTVDKILSKKEYYAPQVFIELNALLKMQQYCQQCDKEIGWLGLVKVENGNDPETANRKYIIYDTLLCKQDVTSVTTDLHEEGLQDIANDFIAKGEFDKLNDVKCWGHSHVNMEVSPSGTDEDSFKDFYSTSDYFIRIIANKKGDLKLDIVLNDVELRFDNIEWRASYPNEMKNLQKEIEDCIKKYEELNAIFDGHITGMKDLITASIKDEIKEKVKESVIVYKSNDKSKNSITTTKHYEYPVETHFYTMNGNVVFTKEELDDVLDFKDIEYIAYSPLEDVIAEYKSNVKFKGYTEEHWQKLINQCEEYMALLEDGYYGYNGAYGKTYGYYK